MNITQLSVSRYAEADNMAGREVVVVTLDTDAGISGTGFHNASFNRRGSTGELAATLLEHYFAPVVVGQDPFLNEDLWQRMYRSVAQRMGRRGLVMGCLSAVDLALWDIKGKALGVPVSALIGGRRDRIPTYLNAGLQLPPDQLGQRLSQYVEQGHTAMKIRCTGLTLNDATRRVEAVREAIGPTVKLMVDVNGTWDAETAISQLKRWEPFDVYWLEEPVPPDDLAGYVRVHQKAGATLIAGGEQHAGVGEFHTLITSGGIDIAQPNASVTGGITDWLRIYHLATAFSIPVSPWNLQPVHVHLAAALPNVKWIEYFLADNPLHDFQTRLWKGPLLHEVRDEEQGGIYLRPPDEPGLGLELNESEAELARVRV